jgi:hypothetical protein
MFSGLEVVFFRRCILAVALWLFFLFGCWVAPFLAPFYVMFKMDGYTQRCIDAADRLCNALLGGSGRVMLSTELAYSEKMKWMRRALDDIAQGPHCQKSAFNEGPYCRLTDHRVRAK